MLSIQNHFISLRSCWIIPSPYNRTNWLSIFVLFNTTLVSYLLSKKPYSLVCGIDHCSSKSYRACVIPMADATFSQFFMESLFVWCRITTQYWKIQSITGHGGCVVVMGSMKRPLSGSVLPLTIYRGCPGRTKNLSLIPVDRTKTHLKNRNALFTSLTNYNFNA